VVAHLPIICEERNAAYVFVPSKQELGEAMGISVGSAAASIIDAGESQHILDEIVNTTKNKIVVEAEKEEDIYTLETIETKLKDFDFTISYGPYLGITRKERYDRAVELGLNPPEEILKLLEHPKASQLSHVDQKNLYSLKNEGQFVA